MVHTHPSCIYVDRSGVRRTQCKIALQMKAGTSTWIHARFVSHIKTVHLLTIEVPICKLKSNANYRQFACEFTVICSHSSASMILHSVVFHTQKSSFICLNFLWESAIGFWKIHTNYKVSPLVINWKLNWYIPRMETLFHIKALSTFFIPKLCSHTLLS